MTEHAMECILEEYHLTVRLPLVAFDQDTEEQHLLEVVVEPRRYRWSII